MSTVRSYPIVRKIINIRHKLKNKRDQSALCEGYFYIHDDRRLRFPVVIITTTKSYIFAAFHDKSLRQNQFLHIIKFAKPKFIETLQSAPYFRQIGIDEDKGPNWCPDSNEFTLDTTYYQRSKIYNVSFIKILNEGDQVRLYKYIAYNHTQFEPRFIKFWHNICKSVPLNITRGSVIFVDGKYLLVSWLANEDIRLCYPGYVSHVDLFAGKQIDIEYEYNLRQLRHPLGRFHFVNQSMWYVSFGEKYDIISTSCSVIEKLYAIQCHQNVLLQKKIQKEREDKSFRSLHLGLKKIHRNLKINKYGTKYSFSYQHDCPIWSDYLQNKLSEYNINVTKRGSTYIWTMLISEANCVFSNNKVAYFQRNHHNITGDIVYLSQMKFRFNVSSGYLRINSKRLKRDSNGVVLGLECLEYPQKDYYSLDTLLNSSILYTVLEYMQRRDIVMFKRVSRQCYVWAEVKLSSVSHNTFMSSL